MAYITSEEIKTKRQEIKKEFPAKEGWKFSITREHNSGIRIIVVEAPIDLMANVQDSDYAQVHGGVGSDDKRFSPEARKALNRIYEIANEGNFDNSDAMTDYFHVGFYVWFSVGAWDKPFTHNKKAA
jgi:hypothetical protein